MTIGEVSHTGDSSQASLLWDGVETRVQTKGQKERAQRKVGGGGGLALREVEAVERTLPGGFQPYRGGLTFQGDTAQHQRAPAPPPPLPGPAPPERILGTRGCGGFLGTPKVPCGFVRYSGR